MSSHAARTKAWRRRRRLGKIALLIEIDEIEAAEQLRIAGVLNAKPMAIMAAPSSGMPWSA